VVAIVAIVCYNVEKGIIMMDAEIKVEFHHVNQKLDRMLDRQNEFITWQRVVGERLASCTALSDTMAKAIEKIPKT